MMSNSRLILLVTLTLLASAGSTAVLSTEDTLFRVEPTTLSAEASDNLLLGTLAPRYSMSRVVLSAHSAPAAWAPVPQLGSGGRGFNVEADMFQRLGLKDAVWGRAAYKNGWRYDVVWNETSDFRELYPYVMGDPIGGDLQYEQYELSGGYSVNYRRSQFGFELGYRALSEYRTRDPRPGNTTADLHGRLAYGLFIGPNSVLGATLLLGKYKQTNELTFMNELGASREYHLTGIGNDFVRFSGTSNNAFYKGHNLGFTLELLPTDMMRGLSVSLGYNHTMREKILSDLNRLPLNRLDCDVLSAEFVWQQSAYGIGFNARHNIRRGKDNLFGEATGNVYPQIGSRLQYHGSETRVGASGFGELRAGRFIFTLMPSVWWTALRGKHADSGNRFETSDLLYALRFKMRFTISKNMLATDIQLGRRNNLTHKLVLNKTADEGRQSTMSLGDALRRVDEYYSGGETGIRFAASYSRSVWGGKILALRLGYERRGYVADAGNEYSAAVSLRF